MKIMITALTALMLTACSGQPEPTLPTPTVHQVEDGDWVNPTNGVVWPEIKNAECLPPCKSYKPRYYNTGNRRLDRRLEGYDVESQQFEDQLKRRRAIAAETAEERHRELIEAIQASRR